MREHGSGVLIERGADGSATIATARTMGRDDIEAVIRAASAMLASITTVSLSRTARVVTRRIDLGAGEK